MTERRAVARRGLRRAWTLTRRVAREPRLFGARTLLASARGLRGRPSAHAAERGSSWPRRVTVVVYVDGSPSRLERRLEALARHTCGPAELVLVDDAVEDPAIAELTARYAARPGVTLAGREQHVGRDRAVAHELERAGDDVVVVGDDVEVGPDWLRRLSRAAAADPEIGAVGAATDDAGSCTYFKRALLREVGARGAASGEDGFWSRARAHGWRHVVDETALTGGTPSRPRLLFVLHEGGGGVVETSRDLAGALAESHDCLLLTSNARTLKLWRHTGDEVVPLRRWRLRRPWRATDLWRADHRAVAREVLTTWDVELVHVRHLFKHTLDLPDVAAELGIPVVLSVHDYYLSCPTVHLLDDHDRFCGGACTPGNGDCRIPSPLLHGLPPLKHRWVYRWRAEVATMLEGVSAAVTTSPYTRKVYRRSLPSLEGKRFEVIPHGRDIQQSEPLGVAPTPGRPVRILLPGNLDVHKGAHFIRTLHEEDRDGRLELHFLGTAPDELAGLGTHHGPYARDAFADHVRRIAPSFVGLFSITAETYNHSLTEAWGAGVPVLATDIGALGERIADHGGGFTVPHDDPRLAYARILDVVDDPAAYGEEAARATLAGLPDVAAMARAYDDLYSGVLASERSFPPVGDGHEDPSPRRPRHRAGGFDLTAFLPGGGGHHPPSTHVRVLRRLGHPAVRSRVATTIVDAGAVPLPPPGTQLALVQRTAIAPDRTAGFLAELRRLGIPLVLELDDDLLGSAADAAHASHASHAGHAESLRVLLEAATLVTASTEPLGERLRELTDRIAVVPNMLDERLWLEDLDRPEGTDPVEGRPLRIVYVGSPSHARDLELLRPVIDRLRAEAGLDVELHVVGGEPRSGAQDWYRRVEIPLGCSSYPAFVRWLRGERGRWDIAVAPLVDDVFNAGKSDLKLLEYGALGLPGVYSDVPAYATCAHGLTGLRARNSLESWSTELGRLCADAALRTRIKETAQRYVFSRRCVAHAAPDHLDLLASVLVNDEVDAGAAQRLAAAAATPPTAVDPGAEPIAAGVDG